MKRAILSSFTIFSVVITQMAQAQDQNVLDTVFKAKVQMVQLESCVKNPNDEKCLEAQAFFKELNQGSFLVQAQAILDRSLDLVHSAVVQDQVKLQKIHDIIDQKPKAQYHYQQISAHVKQQIDAASYEMRRFLSVVIELRMLLTRSNLDNANDQIVLREKLETLEHRLELSLGIKQSLLFTRARAGSVVYQIPASTRHVSGMLPFFCEDPKKSGTLLYCEAGTLDVRFDLDLLAKIFDVREGAFSQLVITKAWSENIPVLELLSGYFSGIKTDAKKRTIKVQYYEEHVCGENGQLFSAVLPDCDKPIVTKKHIEKRKNIEAALFELIGEKNESLKLYSNE